MHEIGKNEFKKDLGLSLAAGLLYALAFPPFRCGFTAFAALIPFFIILQTKRGFEALRWSYLTGFFISLSTLYWLSYVTAAGMVGVLLVLPLYFTLYGALHVFLRAKMGKIAWFFLPFVWSAIEYLQSLGEIAFPWIHLGYSQSYALYFIQFAEYTSVYGVSSWVFCLNALLYFAWQNRGYVQKWRYAALFVLLLALPAVHGAITMTLYKPALPVIKVALLQGNIDPFEKWDQAYDERNFAVYEGLMRSIAAQKPDLCVWPETAVPFYLRSEQSYLRRIRALVDSLDVPVMTGMLDYEYDDAVEYHYYNAAAFLEPHSQALQSYAKMKLVPFSERVPYKDHFPFRVLKNVLSDMVTGIGDYSPGKDWTVFKHEHPDGEHAEKFRFAVSICYESVFPDFVRRQVRSNADFLIVITNDAWFGRTSAPYQHTQIAVFRAIENRVTIARCANTGISCFIDPLGRVKQSTRIFTQAAIVGDVSLKHVSTFYTRYGNIYALFALALSAGAVLVALVMRRNPKKYASQN